MKSSIYLPVRKLLGGVGAYLLQVQSTTRPELKGPDDPVSQADRESEARLKLGLQRIIPDAQFRGEESPWSRWKSRAWLVDSIDGTRNYLNGESEWAISVALMEGNRPVFSMISLPALDTVYHAERGKGAFKNGSRIHVSYRSLEQQIVTMSPHGALKEENRPFLGSFPEDRRLYAGSAAHKLCLVAEGKADVFSYLVPGSPHEWDVAAGDLILAEAGGMLTNVDGSPLCYNNALPGFNGIVASNGRDHDALLERARYAFSKG